MFSKLNLCIRIKLAVFFVFKMCFSVSYHCPVSVVQYTNKAKKFILWNIQNAFKDCLLAKKEIQLPYNDYIVEAMWNPDGSFFILNKIGCIYMVEYLPNSTT